MAIKDRILPYLPHHHISVGKSFPLDCCIPVYHTVSDEVLPHINHCVAYKNISEFVRDLEFMQREFRFITWDEFKTNTRTQTKNSKKTALLTFDDGLAEFNDIIAPILLEKGIFAMNFINPQFIDNQDLSFRAKASILVEEIKNGKALSKQLLQQLSWQNQDNLAKNILKIPYAQRDILDQIALDLGISFKEYLQQHKPYLGLQQIHDLEKKGFGFGAHSWDHPLYEELNIDTQIIQTRSSLQYLKDQQLNCEAFAFPFTDYGVEKAFFNRLFEEEKNLFCTFGCAGIKTDTVLNNWQRIPMENRKTAKQTLQQEIAYYRLKNFLGKNTLYR